MLFLPARGVKSGETSGEIITGGENHTASSSLGTFPNTRTLLYASLIYVAERRDSRSRNAVPASAKSSSQSEVASPFTSNIAMLYLGQTDLLSSVESLPSVST